MVNDFWLMFFGLMGAVGVVGGVNFVTMVFAVLIWATVGRIDERQYEVARRDGQVIDAMKRQLLDAQKAYETEQAKKGRRDADG